MTYLVGATILIYVSHDLELKPMRTAYTLVRSGESLFLKSEHLWRKCQVNAVNIMAYALGGGHQPPCPIVPYLKGFVMNVREGLFPYCSPLEMEM